MRIGMMRHRIEMWDVVSGINEYGIETKEKKLLFKCPAAIKFIKRESVGSITHSVNTELEFTIRFNRSHPAPTNQMYIVFHGEEYDITGHNNWYGYDKYVTLRAVKRSK
ncbi:hypothetical protein BA746_00340 [Vibrio parahaemolyticus]|uniref:head-tail adaptor protein n=1 Tax=Vibrio parahaemolyticus TaxID=670 RepID=UPI0006A58016|nr:head-tail adaptor protein [Vibrio parahaemolyticus]OTW07817.1 hypothetical protein BA743_16335 [Vibrio parahaemolyticus]OTW23948.1 hypothetical protein BA744_01040 [Vibrio parahaemolyticus]OTW27242.1 hypothetical protein BA746_00340 [Vibrio parahaemolyticus]